MASGALEAEKDQVAGVERRDTYAAESLQSVEPQASATERESRGAKGRSVGVSAANELLAIDADSEGGSDGLGGDVGRACDVGTGNEVSGRKRRAEGEGGGELKRRDARGSSDHIRVRVKLYFNDIVLDLKPSETIWAVKDRIRIRAGIIAHRRLIHTRDDVYTCKRLEEDNLTVSDCKINSDSTLHMM